MPETSGRGEVITFYSYKGGTGRTMALANVACLLAQRVGASERVLVVDWDLEAPGLHRFFPGRVGHSSAATELGLDASPGVIDIFTFLHEHLPAEPAASEEAGERAAASAIASLSLDRYLGESGIPRLQILRAGRNDDGEYSKRVNTFNWETLFRRAPSIYRRFAERLAAQFRYVLIDSRTGVTDISGICTALLPEKLVVVFTPNRQSLTGMQDLVRRATSYRRQSDDLRSLLIYPLPSRIEASLEDLRTQWRFGNRDSSVVGYQPMFESALAEAYGLATCDLREYFEQVQIQQTPDYAYGEEIAVTRSNDRFSLGNSYRVFADRLASGAPPWSQAAVEVVGAEEKASAAPPRPVAPPAPAASAPGPSRGAPSIFLSYAREDVERVRLIAHAFRERGWNVWFENQVPLGLQWQQAITEALDSSNAIVVCWSKTSVASDFVKEEAHEGLRRGILVPVLLDPIAPPLGFRQLQSADLSRQDPRDLQTLVTAVAIVAGGLPGSPAAPAFPAKAVQTEGAPRARLSGRRFSAAVGGALAALLVLATLATWFGSRGGMAEPPAGAGLPAGGALGTVPDLVGADTNDVRKTAELLKLAITMRDEQGNESPSLDGVVTSQTPAAGTLADANTRIQLRVATATVIVPVLVRGNLSQMYGALEQAGLRLGRTESRYVPNTVAGTVISQTPEAGARVAAGSAVDLVVAAVDPMRPRR